MNWRFSHRRYRLLFRFPLRTAHGEWKEREGIYVRLEDGAGVARYGEAAPIPWFGTETADEVEAACRALGASLDPEAIAAIPAKLGRLRSALAGALAEESAIPKTTSLPVAAFLPAGRAAIAAAEPKVEMGFRVFKWKVGVTDVSDELVVLDDLCAVLPANARLRLDANGAWDRRSAERWLKRCADRPVEFVEQPIAPASRGADDLLLGLAADYPTPLALDESLVGDGDIDRWLGLGWRGVFIVKPSLLADLPGALGRLTAARSAVVFSAALETAIGAQTALRAAFRWPGEQRALGFGVWPIFVDSRFDGPAAVPFLRWEDVERINPETLWNALS